MEDAGSAAREHLTRGRQEGQAAAPARLATVAAPSQVDRHSAIRGLGARREVPSSRNIAEKRLGH